MTNNVSMKSGGKVDLSAVSFCTDSKMSTKVFLFSIMSGLLSAYKPFCVYVPLLSPPRVCIRVYACVRTCANRQ